MLFALTRKDKSFILRNLVQLGLDLLLRKCCWVMKLVVFIHMTSKQAK